MSKYTRRLVSFLIIAMVLFPQMAFAAPDSLLKGEIVGGVVVDKPMVVGIPLGETQTEYPMSTNSATDNPAKILSVTTTPSKSGSKVHPNLIITTAGYATYSVTVELEKWVNNKWERQSSITGVGVVDKFFQYNPGLDAQSDSTYRFNFQVLTSGSGYDSYYMTGKQFTTN